MERQLENKVIVITGGANGIGFCIANKCLSVGAKTVILLDIEEEQGNASVETLNELYGKDKATFMVCDVTTDVATVGDKIITAYKRVDVLVNSAGIASDDNPKKMMDINATSVVEWSLKFYEHMRNDKGGVGGTIINISSIFGFRICSVAPVYNAAKFAVIGFTRSLGHEDNFKKTGVRVIVLCPGFTETRLTKPLLDKKNKEQISNEVILLAQSFPWQKVDAVGDAAIEVYKNAVSGTAWLIEGGNPIEEVLYNIA